MRIRGRDYRTAGMTVAIVVAAFLLGRFAADNSGNPDTVIGASGEIRVADVHGAEARPNDVTAPDPTSTPVRAEDASMAESPGTVTAPPGETWQRVWVEETSGTDTWIRHVDEMVMDPKTGEPLVVRSVAMLADQLALALPAGTDPDAVRAAIESLGYTVTRSQSFSPVWQIGLGRHDPDAVPEGLAGIAQILPNVTVEPDYLYFPQRVPDDYDSVVLWGLNRIEAPAAWSVSTGSVEVVVAVIDSGAELDHPDLAGNIWVNPGETAGNGIDDDGNGLIDDIHGWDFMQNDNQPDDNGRHGTHVAGTIGAVGDNGTGLVGVNWNTRLIIARAGDETFANSRLGQAIDYVTDLRKAGVPVVATNNSYGGAGDSDILRAAVQRAQAAGVLYVAAAGNDGISIDAPGNATYPASFEYDNVITVASSNLADELSIFSNYGKIDVDLAAPGSAIRSSIPGKGYGYLSGTSMAAPHVTGAIALLKAAEPELGWEVLRDRLFQSVDPVPAFSNRVSTGGRLNIRQLLGLTGPRAIARIVAPEARLVVLEAVDETLDLAGSSGLAEEPVDFRWNVQEGPGEVVFSDPEARTTNAWFSSPGLYRLRLAVVSASEVTTDEITVVVATPPVPTGGLVALWQFEETGGTIALDGSGSARSGTLSGVVREGGPLGNAARFNGTDSSMSFISPVSTAITMAAWVRSDSLGESVFPRIMETAVPANTALNPDFIFYFGRRTADVDADINSIKFYASKSVQDGIWHTASNSIGDGSWIHVAVSYDGSSADNFPSIFLNGEWMPVGVDARSGDQARGVVGNQQLTPGTAYLGENSEGTRAWDGLMDDVRIYSRALSRAEVAWIARESTARPLLDQAFRMPGQVSAAAPFTIGPTDEASIPGATYRWDQPDDTGFVLLDAGDGATARFIALGGGDLRVRLTVSRDGVSVIRSFAVPVSPGTRPETGLFHGSFRSGGGMGEVWAVVNPTGRARFLGVNEGGGVIVADDVQIGPQGEFAFGLADGRTFRGQFGPDDFAGATLDGLSYFGGNRVSVAGDGGTVFLGGPLVNSEDSQLQVWLGPDGSIYLVRSDSGEVDAASGSIDGEGRFLLQASSGALISGLLDFESMVGRGRIEDEASSAPFYLAGESGFGGERLANISTRGTVGVGDAIMIAGFSVEGGPSSLTLLRGVGPGLEGFDLQNRAASTALLLKRGSVKLLSNQGWKSNPDASRIEDLSSRNGAFPLSSDFGDSALLANLEAGVYTVALSDPSAVGGLALLEIYDVGGDAEIRLVNLSTRGRAATGEDALIAGFVLDEDLPRRLLIRAVGPGLDAYDVAGTLGDPRMDLFLGSEKIASNEDWEAGGRGELIAELNHRVGAFPLEPGSRDAALTRYLDPGRYTVRVQPADGVPGIVLLEIYVVPDPVR